MSKHITPTAPTGRIEMLDALRGFAIFGILMVNMSLFYKPISSMLLGYTGSESNIGLVGELFIKFFFEGKFYVIFSMLFGYGFWLFISRTTCDGRSIIPTYRLRVFFLLLFGAAHVVLLWPGDILVFYALFGFVLILYKKVSDRGLIKWAFWLALIPSMLMFLFFLMFLLASMHPESKAAFEAGMQANAQGMKLLVEKSAEVYTQGSFKEIVAARLTEYMAILPGILFFYPVVMAMFLVGVWAARKQIFKNYEQNIPFFRKALIWGLSIGIPANILYAYAYVNSPANALGFFGFLGTFMHTVGGLTMSLTYISIIVLLTAKGKFSGFHKYLAPVGRMALTNYLMHSIICTTIFLSYGLGLYGQFNVWQGILLTICIYIIQIPLSKFWLKHFNYGPFEWLWRSLTYMKLQPFKKTAMLN